MSYTAIKVENLSKIYRLGTGRGYKTFREAIVNSVKAPLLKLAGGHQKSNLRHLNSETLYALKEVAFDVKHGEVVGIIGRNGAGKSTLLKVLSKITEPTKGRIEIRGRVGSLLEIGTGFHPELTGHENIYLYGAILGMDRWEVTKKFDEIIAFANLEKFIETPVKRYSSGMYMRLAFAVAAHLETEIILIDEVLAVGDIGFQKKCLGKMGDMAKEGRTVLFVSHNMAAIRKLCTRAVLLNSGEIVKYCSAEECVKSYISNSFKKSGKIIDHIKHQDKAISIKSITLNDSDSDNLVISAKTTFLQIEIEGTANSRVRMELEARFFDLYDNPLAFYSPGHETGCICEYKPGRFKIERSIALPRIMRGEYLVSFSLTTPNSFIWVDIPYAVTISAEGTSTITGQTFDYYKQKIGWIFLSDKLDKNNVN